MAIELQHLHPSHDDELLRLKSRIAELEKENAELKYKLEGAENETNYWCNNLKVKIAELKKAQRWRKFSEEKPPKYTWCLVSGKSQMGNYIVIRDFFEEDDWAENPNLDDDTLDIEYWMPLPSEPKKDK